MTRGRAGSTVSSMKALPIGSIHRRIARCLFGQSRSYPLEASLSFFSASSASSASRGEAKVRKADFASDLTPYQQAH